MAARLRPPAPPPALTRPPPRLPRRDQLVETVNVHRSNAEQLVARVPVVEVDQAVVMCDGGGGATGHPIEYIKLDLKEGAGTVNTCKYCGVRYKMKAHHH